MGATRPTGTSSFSPQAAASTVPPRFWTSLPGANKRPGLFTTNMSLTAKHVATVAATAKTSFIRAPQLYSYTSAVKSPFGSPLCAGGFDQVREDRWLRTNALHKAFKKKKEEETQTLQVPKDPPSAVAAETRRLVFHVTPLSAKGLLSQQVRDALKALFRLTGSLTVVKVRAFVAGSGDVRRVRDIVSESFTDRRQSLPALSVIQVGALPLEGAQVVLESVAVARKDVNNFGLIFIAGQGASSNNPRDPVQPLGE
jgi:hypothetical protein